MSLLVFALFIVVPLLELYVIIEVGGAIGVMPTLGLMLLTAVVGAALLRSQGRTAWLRFNRTMAAGRVPAREVFDGAMIILGGALLLTPGFITDVVGISLLLPPGRALVRSVVRGVAARTPKGRPVFFVYDRFGSPRADRGGGQPQRPPGSASRDYDVEGSAREVDEYERELPPGAGSA